MKAFSFSRIAVDGKARRGFFSTFRGRVDTPAFMPVGTSAAVKSLLSDMVVSTGSQIVLANTYHLMLRPGIEIIKKLGGLHKFMNWNLPILTDSGGFQVMSLSGLRKISEDGTSFKSHIDGKELFISPEKSVIFQMDLGVDIAMIFDECVAYPASEKVVKDSTELSARWALRSKRAFEDHKAHAGGDNCPTTLFGIQQGGVFKGIREYSSKSLIDIGFGGYAIGGLAVGEGQETLLSTLDFCVDMLPADCPRYLMGVGIPEDLVESVFRGVDMFDCVAPTRLGRHGRVLVPKGYINIKNSIHREDSYPLDENCDCLCCKNYSRAYLHHLFKCGEISCATLMSYHNIYYLQCLMSDIRASIEAGCFLDFRKEFYSLRNNSPPSG